MSILTGKYQLLARRSGPTTVLRMSPALSVLTAAHRPGLEIFTETARSLAAAATDLHVEWIVVTDGDTNPTVV